MSVHFSSKTDEWATPQDFFDEVNERYGPFDLDVCATPENAKCEYYFTREVDGLGENWKRWGPRCWMNPPYGREIGKWVKKAYEESRRGVTVACLLPARTDTAWFHDWVLNKAEIEFIRGRLKFGGAKNPAPFPSMLAIYGREARND